MYAGRLLTISRHRGAGRGMYVCMYVHTIVDGMACMCSICLYYPASLTLSLAVMSAPCWRRSEQRAVWPFQAAQWRAVHPIYNNRETERQRERDRSDQIRDTQERNTTDTQIEEDSRVGQGREGYDRVECALTWRGDRKCASCADLTWRGCLLCDADQAPSRWTTMDRETISHCHYPYRLTYIHTYKHTYIRSH